MGRLGVSRAFGDKSLKTYVIADPDIITMPLKEGDDFLVLACDGLWDVVDIETVTDLVRQHTASKGLQAAAQVKRERERERRRKRERESERARENLNPRGWRLLHR